MPNVFFYHNAHDKWGTVCQLLKKAAAQGKSVMVYSASQERLDRLDRLLWTFDPLSFVPHCWVDSDLASATPILLTDSLAWLSEVGRVFNLDESPLTDLSPETALIEVVGQEDEDRVPARQRFRVYKNQGYPIQAIDLAVPRENREG